MKITIWIHKSEAISGNITKYYTHGLPQTTSWPDYVQVQISQDEFARLEDNQLQFISEEEMDELEKEVNEKDKWLVDQYNRNREPKDWIKDADEIPDRLAYLLSNKKF